MTPQLKSFVRPVKIPGTPGILPPIAYQLGVERMISPQTEGSRLISKCGSLDKMGLPLLVRLPPITQLFDAIILGAPISHNTEGGTTLSSR